MRYRCSKQLLCLEFAKKISFLLFCNNGFCNKEKLKLVLLQAAVIPFVKSLIIYYSDQRELKDSDERGIIYSIEVRRILVLRSVCEVG